MVILGAVYGLGFATLVPTCARKEAQIAAEEITIRFIYIYIYEHTRGCINISECV